MTPRQPGMSDRSDATRSRQEKAGSSPSRRAGSELRGLPLQAQSLLHMQQRIGNAGVRQFMRRFRAQQPQREQPAHAGRSAPAGEAIQAKFTYSREHDLFIDEDTGFAYRLLGTIGYGDLGRRAYQLEGDTEYVLVDMETFEAVRRQPHVSSPVASASGSRADPEEKPSEAPDENKTSAKKEKARLFSDLEDDSDYAASDDDEKVELNDEQRLRILMRQGKLKRRRLEGGKLKIKESKFELHDPRSRKALIAHRQSKTSKLSRLDKQEYFWLGEQTIRLGEGTGYFIQPGGNEREEGIAEPPAEYNALFEQMKRMGNDKNASRLYELATGKTRGNDETFTDSELATLALYYMNNDASAIARQLGSRSQLLEHLGKFTAITGISEFGRSMEAVDGKDEVPYDATLLVKQGLMSVISGKKTLKQVFYEGKGGENSIFLGAPSEKHSSKKLGGAEILRNPFRYEANLRRQMEIFPTNKKEFKSALNRLKSQSAFELPSITEEDLKKQEELVALEQSTAANQLLERINGLTLPERVEDRNKFLNEGSGEIHKIRGTLKKWKKAFAGNKIALAVVMKAEAALNKKVLEFVKKM